MTDAAAPIDVAREPPFRLSGTEVRPSSLEIIAPGGARTVLEHRIMQTLVALASRRGDVVSRDTLVDLCWEGRIVSDDAIHRCISRLRALADDLGGFTIETIPRVGYRLVETAPVEAPPPPPRGRRVVLVAAGATLGVAAAVAAVIAIAGPRTAWEVDRFELATSEAGVEMSPGLSRDGRLLAYTRVDFQPGSPDNGIYYQRTTGGEPVQLTHAPPTAVAATWSPSGDQLAFVRGGRSGSKEHCHLMVKPFPAGPERTVGDCAGLSVTWKLSWTPGEDGLIYHDRPANGGAERIRLLDLRSGAARDLTRPPQGGADLNPVLSPDGRRLAFMRRYALGQVRVIVQDLKSGKATPVGPNLYDAWPAWSDDGGTIFVADSRKEELWAIPVRGRGEPRRLLAGIDEIARLASAPGLLVFQVQPEPNRLVRRAAAGDETTIAPAGEGAWAPAFSPGGALAFLAKNGWLVIQQPGAPPRRYLQLDYALGELRWSPDGARIVFTGVDRGEVDLYVLEVASGKVIRLPSPGLETRSPVWSADGSEIAFAGKDAKGWRILAVSWPRPGSPRPLSDYGWRAVRAGPAGYYAVPADGGGVWRLGPPHAERVADFPPALAMNSEIFDGWAIVGDQAYVLDARRTANRSDRLTVQRLGGGPARTLAGEADFWGLAVDPRSGDLVYSKESGPRQVNIGMLRVSRRAVWP